VDCFKILFVRLALANLTALRPHVAKDLSDTMQKIVHSIHEAEKRLAECKTPSCKL
jgi:hypothetical protein